MLHAVHFCAQIVSAHIVSTRFHETLKGATLGKNALYPRVARFHKHNGHFQRRLMKSVLRVSSWGMAR